MNKLFEMLNVGSIAIPYDLLVSEIHRGKILFSIQFSLDNANITIPNKADYCPCLKRMLDQLIKLK